MIKFGPMSFRRLHLSLLSGLLLAALLLQSLLPAFAAVRAEQGSRWIEVCVSSGIKWVKLDTGKADSAPHAANAHADHCVLCAATGPEADYDVTHYLPAQSAAIVVLPALSVPVTAFPGHALRSRAPPVFS